MTAREPRFTPEPRPGYRPGVGIMLLDSGRRVFVARRIDTAEEAWQMPQGGIAPGEDPAQAAVRELEEEIGTARATLLAEAPGWLSYDLPPEIARRVWGGRYRGQSQKWLAFRFDGTDADIDVATAHAEFADWKWVEPERLPDLIVPFKRRLYEDVLAAFAHLLDGGGHD